MTSPPKSRSSAETRGHTYTLKITLSSVEPPIWRRLRVPGGANLGWLHAVIQVAMGWTNSHLHQFTAGEQTYSDPRFEIDMFEDDPLVLDENEVTLRHVVPRQKDSLGYEYDFGDSWNHEIVVEQMQPCDPAAPTIAECIDGARACPPDDCGGPWGYEDLLEILSHPEHEEHQSMKEWLGRPFDPEVFDHDNVNKYLRTLKWPHTSEEQLGRVLMQRDDVSE